MYIYSTKEQRAEQNGRKAQEKKNTIIYVDCRAPSLVSPKTVITIRDDVPFVVCRLFASRSLSLVRSAE